MKILPILIEGFLDRFMPYCRRYSEPRFAIFMDNALFHFFSPRIKQILVEAGVIAEYKPSYSLNLSPVKYLFGSVKIAPGRNPARIKTLFRARQDNDKTL